MAERSDIDILELPPTSGHLLLQGQSFKDCLEMLSEILAKGSTGLTHISYKQEARFARFARFPVAPAPYFHFIATSPHVLWSLVNTAVKWQTLQL